VLKNIILTILREAMGNLGHYNALQKQCGKHPKLQNTGIKSFQESKYKKIAAFKSVKLLPVKDQQGGVKK
jgi:hypothetical protein